MSAPWMSDAEIVRSYQNAVNPRAQPQVLADINGCSRDDIMEILRRNGADMEAASCARNIDYYTVYAMFNDGYSDADIAAKIGCSKCGVQFWRLRNGITRRKRKRKRETKGQKGGAT